MIIAAGGISCASSAQANWIRPSASLVVGVSWPSRSIPRRHLDRHQRVTEMSDFLGGKARLARALVPSIGGATVTVCGLFCATGAGDGR